MRRIAAVLAFCLLSSIQVSPHSQADGEIQLERARKALTGQNKNPEAAKKILLDLVNSRRPALRSSSLCYAYVYLGYIADRAGSREAAVGWFTKAAAVAGAGPGILEIARGGLQKPVTWIRHLDEGTPLPGRTPAATASPAPAADKEPNAKDGYVTASQPPAGLIPLETLSAEEWQKNFEFLWDALDRTYACFKLRSIDWQGVHARYLERLKSVTSSGDFYSLLFQLVNELKDTHSWLVNHRLPRLPFGPGLSLDLFEGKPYLVAVNPASSAAAAGAQIGSEVLAVDGLTIEEKMEQLRAYLTACSSERAYRREACRQLLGGEAGSNVSVKLRLPDGRTESLSLKRDFPQTGRRPSSRAPDFNLTRQKFVHYGRHPSGVAYIWIESFNGREEIADEFDTALQALRDAPGLIIDVRDNTGGFGPSQPRIVGRFITARTLVAVGYRKSGPGHDDLAMDKTYFEPSGNWQYKRPVVLLVNDVTGSAADLFTCYMRSTKRVTTIGSTTHGNLSGVAAYAVLPCGLVVRISNGYVCDAAGRPIEGNGSDPDIAVSPSIGDFLADRDPVLDKAVAFLRGGKQ